MSNLQRYGGLYREYISARLSAGFTASCVDANRFISRLRRREDIATQCGEPCTVHAVVIIDGHPVVRSYSGQSWYRAAAKAAVDAVSSTQLRLRSTEETLAQCLRPTAWTGPYGPRSRRVRVQGLSARGWYWYCVAVAEFARS